MSAWMQKQQARSTRAAAMTSAASDDATEHASEQRISMYTEAPPGEVCIEDFERFAIDRLRGADSSVASILPNTSGLFGIFQDVVYFASHQHIQADSPWPVLFAVLHVHSIHPCSTRAQGKMYL